MSANFFKVNRGLRLDPQTATGSSDPIGADGDIYYNDVLAKFRKFENGAWSDLGSGGSGSSLNSRSGNQVVNISDTSATIIFSTPLTTNNYTVLVDMVNSVDPTPQYQSMIVTNKQVTGFTVTWNAPTDSADYSIDYIVPGNLVALGEVVVPAASTSLTVTLNIAYATSNYAVMAMLQDVTDPSPQLQPVIITNKTNTTFDVQWNAPTDSSNYVITYQAMGFA